MLIIAVYYLSLYHRKFIQTLRGDRMEHFHI
jgi:hypothetical protein